MGPKLERQFVILYLAAACVVLPLAAVVFSIDQRVSRDSGIFDNLRRQLIHIDFTISALIHELESDVRYLAADPVVRALDDRRFARYLSSDGGGSSRDADEAELLISEVFGRYRKAHPQIVSVFMGRANGSYISSPAPNPQGVYDPRDQPWYKLGLAGIGTVARTAPSPAPSAPDVHLSGVTALVDENGAPYGVIGIEISLAGPVRYVESIRIGDQGFLMLADKESSLLANPLNIGPPPQGAELNEAYAAGIGEDNEGIAGVSGFSLQGKKERQVLYYYRSPDSSLLLIAVMPKSELWALAGPGFFRLCALSGLFLTFLTILGLLQLRKFILYNRRFVG